jgi:hypothetical protein
MLAAPSSLALSVQGSFGPLAYHTNWSVRL